MGSKFKCFVTGLLLFTFEVSAQTGSDFQSVDSLTYSYYKAKDWNNLIKLGSEAIDSGIDYKYLRQRLGLAFFSKGNYIQAIKHMEKALSFDSYDSFTLTYLYYSYLNSGQSENAGFISGKMPDDLKKSLSVKSFQPVESIDFEYDIKYSSSRLRSNPQYYHFGINTTIGSKLELYQMFSHYNQTITVQAFGQKEFIKDIQPEYYALLKFKFLQHWMLKSAYHYVSPKYDTITTSAHLGYLELSVDLGRFNIGFNTSALKNAQYTVEQSGIKVGGAFSGNLNMYFSSVFSFIQKQYTSQLIYSQAIGFRIFKKVWLEGNITIGDMTNYHDHDAMYVYNLIDPTAFRTGATLFIYSGKHITIWTNYSFERKKYYENSQYHYNQFSYLGGMKWKF
jgi:tetratricopeptide (TPR) repeat protein